MELLLKNKKKDSASPAIAGDNLPLSRWLLTNSEHSCCTTDFHQSVRDSGMMPAVTSHLADEFSDGCAVSVVQSHSGRHPSAFLTDGGSKPVVQILQALRCVVGAGKIVDLCTSQQAIIVGSDCGYSSKCTRCEYSVHSHGNDLSPLIQLGIRN